MTVTSVIGLQWGDEAKGKIVDLLTGQHDIVVRYQGGNNAGHTVKFDGETYKLSLLPAGILNDRVTSVIAPGVVINPSAFFEELNGRGTGLAFSEGEHRILANLKNQLYTLIPEYPQADLVTSSGSLHFDTSANSASKRAQLRRNSFSGNSVIYPRRLRMPTAAR